MRTAKVTTNSLLRKGDDSETRGLMTSTHER